MLFEFIAIAFCFYRPDQTATIRLPFPPGVGVSHIPGLSSKLALQVRRPVRIFQNFTTSSMKKNSTGRVILISLAALTATGGFIADLNKTHLFNPNWTPHSKFHDAMTILLATMLGSGSIYLLQKKDGDKDLQLKIAALLPASFWTAMLGSFAFPGAKGIEAEFPEKVKKVGPVVLNEAAASIGMLSLIGLAYIAARKVNS